MSPALAGRFFATGPPGKPWLQFCFFFLKTFFSCSQNFIRWSLGKREKTSETVTHLVQHKQNRETFGWRCALTGMKISLVFKWRDDWLNISGHKFRLF